MYEGNDSTSNVIRSVSSMVDYEALFSRPGAGEPDSSFMWTSKFSAPVGMSFLGETLYFNLFLPGGSENEADKKVFLNRVGAKFQDGLWQIRRKMDDKDGSYGHIMKIALMKFRSLVLVNAFIRNGRTYTHFVFNRGDLPAISRAALSVPKMGKEISVEYLKKTDGENILLKRLQDTEDVYAVSLQIKYPPSKLIQSSVENETPFVLTMLHSNGIKGVGKLNGIELPSILNATDMSEINGKVVSFSSNNDFLINLMKSIVSDYIVVYGVYGVVRNDSLNVIINVPKQQTAPLMRLINGFSDTYSSLELRLKEVISYRDLKA